MRKFDNPAATAKRSISLSVLLLLAFIIVHAQTGSIKGEVKTSDNSENSSSSKIRAGTTIEKWFRRYSIRGLYNWEALKTYSPKTKASEDGFRAFVQEVIKTNPSCINI